MAAPKKKRRVLAGEVLTSLSADWYWEQDEALRFTRIVVQAGSKEEHALARRSIGKRRWETGLSVDGGWDEHRRLLESRAPFRDLLVWRDFEDGSRRYVRVSGEPVFDAQGLFTGYRGVGRDVTEQRQTEMRLRESEERFRRTFELAGSGVAHLSRERRFLRVNRKLCEILGYSEAELMQRSVIDVSHPDDLDMVEAQRERLYAGEVGSLRVEKRYVRKDGAHIWATVTVALERDAAGHPMYEITVYDDITERKAAESALRESEARFRSLTHLSSDWFWEQDTEHRFTRLEGRYVAGGDPTLRTRLIGKRRWETGLEVEGGWAKHRAVLEARQPFHGALMWRTMADGTLRFVAVSGEPMFGADGSFAGYRGVGRDVTGEKRAEQLLRLEHQVANTLSEAADAAGGITAVMRLVCEAEGWACGRYFGVDASAESLAYEHGWRRPDSASFAEFLDGSHGLRYKRGQGLAGIVWQTGEPVFSSDATRDPRTMAKKLALKAARGAFVFAVKVEGETIGVLSFTSAEVREPDARLLESAKVIGSQVGTFLRRVQAEESTRHFLEALRESEARFRALTEMSSDFFWETDAQHRLTSVVHGPHYSEKIGHIVGKAAWELPYTHPEDSAWGRHRAVLEAHQPFREFEFGRPWPDGSVRYFSVSGEPRFGAEGAFLGYRGVGRDVTEVMLARERIASLAFHDVLTGLANRASMLPALEQSVERTRRRGTMLAGLFIDLDGFKEVNDAHGHDAGDRLLVEAARRLRAALRSGDPIARLGGDEFFAVLEDLHDSAPAERVARKLLEAIEAPYDLGNGRSARVSASIGISLYPDDSGDAGTLMKHADTAMYAVKQAGKNGFRFYSARPAANDAADASAERDSG